MRHFRVSCRIARILGVVPLRFLVWKGGTGQSHPGTARIEQRAHPDEHRVQGAQPPCFYSSGVLATTASLTAFLRSR